MTKIKKLLKWLNPKTYEYVRYHNKHIIESDANVAGIMCIFVAVYMFLTLVYITACPERRYDSGLDNMPKIISSIVMALIGVVLAKIPIINDRAYIIERQFTRIWVAIVFLWLAGYGFIMSEAKADAIFVYLLYCIVCITLLHENPILYSLQTIIVCVLTTHTVLEYFNSYGTVFSYIGVMLATITISFYTNYLTRQKLAKNDSQLLDNIMTTRLLKENELKLYENEQKLHENEKKLQDKTAETLTYMQSASMFQNNISLAIANLVESRDNDTGTHLKATSFYTYLITTNLIAMNEPGYEISLDFAKLVNRAAPMHDLGKISIPDKILKAPRRLTADEFEIMKQHTVEGANLIQKIYKGIESKAYIKVAYNIARYHHERWDGTGYPDQKANIEIPLEARIMTVADVFDALVSKRCYKDAYPLSEAFDEIQRDAGTHFDPTIVKAFLMSKDEIEEMILNDFITISDSF